MRNPDDHGYDNKDGEKSTPSVDKAAVPSVRDYLGKM